MELEVLGAVLVAETVAGDDNGLVPVTDNARNIFANDRLAENCAVKDVADGAIGAAPHLFEPEFFDARFIGSDGCALDGDAELFGGVGRIDGDLIVGLVAFFDGEIVVFEIDIEVGKDQAFANRLPDDARHLVSVHFDDGVQDFDF